MEQKNYLAYHRITYYHLIKIKNMTESEIGLAIAGTKAAAGMFAAFQANKAKELYFFIRSF